MSEKPETTKNDHPSWQTFGGWSSIEDKGRRLTQALESHGFWGNEKRANKNAQELRKLREKVEEENDRLTAENETLAAITHDLAEKNKLAREQLIGTNQAADTDSLKKHYADFFADENNDDFGGINPRDGEIAFQAQHAREQLQLRTEQSEIDTELLVGVALQIRDELQELLSDIPRL